MGESVQNQWPYSSAEGEMAREHIPQTRVERTGSLMTPEQFIFPSKQKMKMEQWKSSVIGTSSSLLRTRYPEIATTHRTGELTP